MKSTWSSVPKLQRAVDNPQPVFAVIFLPYSGSPPENRTSSYAGLLAQASSYCPSSHSHQYSDMSDNTLPLQWRDRAGLAPASLLAALYNQTRNIRLYETTHLLYCKLKPMSNPTSINLFLCCRYKPIKSGHLLLKHIPNFHSLLHFH